MPRFYFHLRHGRESIIDDEGSELPHCEAAYLYAFDSAQELWTMLLDRREDPAGYTFEVVDAEARMVFLLPLNEVLEITRKRRLPASSEALHRASALLSYNKRLRSLLSEEIVTTREQIGHTLGLLRELHARGGE